MRDSLNGLRHQTVIGCHDQNNHVSDVGSAGTHFCKGGVAWCIQEADLLPATVGNLVRTNMLGNAAGFARNHIRFAEIIQDGCLTVVYVTHNRHNRRPCHQCASIWGWGFQTLEDVVIGDAFDGMAQFVNNQFGRISVDALAGRSHDTHFHQDADDVSASFSHAVCQFTHGDDFWHDDFTTDLCASFTRFLCFLAFTLTLALDRCQ